MMLNQRGFATIAFLLLIFSISALIIGGSFYIKNSLNYDNKQSSASKNLTSESINNNNTQEFETKNVYTKQPVSPGDGVINSDFNLIFKALMCYYDLHNYYPQKLTEIDTSISSSSTCKDIKDFSIIDPQTNQPYEYTISQSGKSYKLRAKLLNGQSFESSDFENENLKRTRDANRMADLASLQQAINVTAYENSGSDKSFLCASLTTIPCTDHSSTGSLSIDGSGWVKINLEPQQSVRDSGVRIPFLPKDPINDSRYHYTYCADQKDWEINTIMESKWYSNQMKTDGGNDDSVYEIGSNANLIGKNGLCQY